MKKILITGTNSYIGNATKNWLQKEPDRYFVSTIDMKCDDWRKSDFSSFDVIFHVAGIAHVSASPQMESIYYKVNRDLAIETAIKAKREGVHQFIFMSSIIVYGDKIANGGRIDKNSIPQPANFYGKSKLQAEEGMKHLGMDSFRIVILRPPMIYGKGAKGNYPKLSKAARSLPFFPDFENRRSMLHIDNLCEFVKLMIDNEEKGLFFPQNREYVKTSDMVKIIAGEYGKNIRLTKVFNPLLKAAMHKSRIVNKAFGNLFYDQSISNYKYEYRVRNLIESIHITETGKHDASDTK